MSDVRPPLPPFTAETAAQKVRAAEDGWNSRDPQRVSLAYSPDSVWRNRSTFVRGRERIVEFLSGKWQREQEYRLIKELWAFTGNRIAVRFAYEWHDDSGNWFRSYGNENWAFDEQGLMYERHASINDLPIREDQRLFRWPLGRRYGRPSVARRTRPLNPRRQGARTPRWRPRAASACSIRDIALRRCGRTLDAFGTTLVVFGPGRAGPRRYAAPKASAQVPARPA